MRFYDCCIHCEHDSEADPCSEPLCSGVQPSGGAR
jgi:hypothetical protein